ncbi:MAG: hypothetical protein ACK462_02175, partial [Planctomyces sp.]
RIEKGIGRIVARLDEERRQTVDVERAGGQKFLQRGPPLGVPGEEPREQAGIDLAKDGWA